MNAQALVCPKCRAPLPVELFNGEDFAPCPGCRRKLRCEVFPAYHVGPRIGRAGELLIDPSEASCFFHTEKKAVVACENCGRFLCSLCDLEFDGRHLCPNCLAAARKKGALAGLDHYRLSWFGLALLLSVVPLIFFYPLSLLTAPAAIVVALIGLRQPPSLTGRRRWISCAAALLFSLGQIGAWIWFGRHFLQNHFGG